MSAPAVLSDCFAAGALSSPGQQETFADAPRVSCWMSAIARATRQQAANNSHLSRDCNFADSGHW